MANVKKSHGMSFDDIVERTFEVSPEIDGVALYENKNNLTGLTILNRSSNTEPSGDVVVYRIGGDSLAEVSSKEWDDLMSGKTPVPEGWSKKPLKVVLRKL